MSRKTIKKYLTAEQKLWQITDRIHAYIYKLEHEESLREKADALVILRNIIS
jgi:hypothetical protein